MLIGGKSRAAVALNPEKTRFISLCIRLSSANGSKPNPGNSESAMVHLHVHPGNACGWQLARHTGKVLAADSADRYCRERGEPRGRRWRNNSDHILAAKRHDRGRPSLVRPSFPAETR